MKYIFLSYRSLETDFALSLAADLKNAGMNIWMDRLDIRPGEDWMLALERAVNDCSALIAVMTPDYVASDHCRRELKRADRLHRPIFPLLLRSVPEWDLPFEVEGKQYIDFTNWRETATYQRQLEKLIGILKTETDVHVSAIPDEETRYLNTLIAEIEARRDVLEYVDLPARGGNVAPPSPRIAEVWSLGRTVEIVRDDVPQEPRLSGIYEALERYPRFVLVGGAGSGKSTLLRYLALESGRDRLMSPRIAPLPILIRLAQWRREDTAQAFIRNQWKLEGDPIDLLARGRAVLYLDGLNEMGKMGADRAVRLRAWLHGSEAPRNLIITCRAGDYTDDLNLDLPLVQLSVLDQPRIQQYVVNYLGSEAAAPLLARILPRSDGEAQLLYEMAQSPFWLSLLVMVYANGGGELPRNTGALLERLAVAWWQHEEKRNSYSAVVLAELKAGLTDLAFAMIDQDMPVYVPVEDVVEYIGSRELVQVGCNTNFLELAGDSVRFTHQLMLEYFAALRLARVGLVTRLRAPQFDDVGRRIPQKWDRVTLALVGLHDSSPDEIVRALLDIDPYLTLECIATGLDVSSTTRRQAVNRVFATLLDEHRDTRLAAADALAKLGHEQAGEIIFDVLREGRWAMRAAGLEMLSHAHVVPVSGVAEALSGLEDEMRSATATALRQLGAAAVPTLLLLLRDERWEMRRGAVWALGEIGDRAAAPALVAALRDPETLVAAEAATALGWLRDEATVPMLLAVLAHENWRVRKAAAAALGWMGGAAIDGLTFILTSESSAKLRRLAVDALAGIRDSRVLAPLLKASRDASPEVRAAALEALAGINNPLSLRRLIEALGDEERPRWRRQRICDIAAQKLEGIGTPRALDALNRWQQGLAPLAATRKLRRLDRYVHRLPLASRKVRLKPVRRRFASREVSGRLLLVSTAVKAAPAPVKLAETAAAATETGRHRIIAQLISAMHVEDGSSGQQDAAKALREYARSLRGKRDTHAVRELIAALDDKSWNVRWTVVEALAWVSDPVSIPALAQCLNDENWMVRIAAIRALIEIGDRSVVDDIIKRMNDSNSMVREAAAEALGSLGSRAAVPRLINALRDDERFVRLAAVEALGRIRDGGAVAALLPLLRDSDHHMRWSVVRTLGQIGDRRAVPLLIERLHDYHEPPLQETRICDEAAQALEAIGTPDALSAVQAWRGETAFNG